jgi:pyruvate dehydrogenase E2 component (dihydrolipoamide acetyltransferase)
MPIDVIVPPLSQTMDVVVLVKWLKRAGEPVAKGEPLFSIETDKATLEIESPAAGVLQQILTPEKTEAKVRSRVAIIAAPGEAAPAPSPVEVTAPTPAPRSSPPAERAPLAPARGPRIFASPRARGLADREGVSLTNLTPTGPQAMIVERDVQVYLATRRRAPTPAAPPVLRQPAGVSVLIREADATALLTWLGQLRAASPTADVTALDLVACIVGRQLREHPAANVLVDEAGARLSAEAGVAINLCGVRCNLRGAGSLSPLAVARLRQATTIAEQPDAAVAVVDMGWANLDLFIPTVAPPQIAALGLGRIRPKSIERDGARCVRPTLSLALTVDSRWIGDEPAARFLADIAQCIEEPYRLL